MKKRKSNTKITFYSIEAAVDFGRSVTQNKCHDAYEPGVVRPGHIDPAGFVEHLARIADNADKIAAIKLYRATFDVGLKEAKEAVERAPIFNRQTSVCSNTIDFKRKS